MNTKELRYKELVNGLRLIALPFDEQVAVLPDFVHVPDEILNAAPSDSWNFLLEEGAIDKIQFEILFKLDKQLDEIQGPEDYEELLEYFKNSAEVQRLRKSASSALEALGFSLEKPDFSHISWVQA